MKMFPWMRQSPLRQEESESGGSGGGTPAFDPAKFEADLLKKIQKMLKPPKLAVKTPPAEAEHEEEHEEETPAQKKDPAVKALQKALADQKKITDGLLADVQRKDSEAKARDRKAALTDELSKAGVPADRMKSALRALDPEIQWNEDGALTGADETPLADYVSGWIKENDMFLPPRNVSGSGAEPGSGRPKNTKALDLDDIKVGMDAKETARIRAEILRIHNGR